jgi:NitT/TauT family transport system permease protein
MTSSPYVSTKRDHPITPGEFVSRDEPMEDREAPRREAALLDRAGREADRDGLIRHAGIAVGRALLIGGFLLLWGIASGRWADRQAISDPLSVVQALVDLAVSGRLWPDLGQTVLEIISGYVIGAAAGLLLALLFALAPSSRSVLRPFLIAFYSIPKIALAPLIVMWFGLGTTPKIILAGAFVFFVVFMNAAAGIESVNRDHVNIVRVMGAGRWTILRKVLLPTVVPFLLVGLRLAIPEALIGAVIGEFISANQGLGYLVNSASAQYNTAVSLAAILALLIIVAVGDLTLGLVERRLLRWRPQALGTPSMRIRAR